MQSFFLSMIPPTVTHQEKRWHVVDGKPKSYESAELKNTRAKLRDHLAAHRPAAPMTGGVRLVVKWCFPRGAHKDGEYRITKPDTDNLQKLLKDVMTELGSGRMMRWWRRRSWRSSGQRSPAFTSTWRS